MASPDIIGTPSIKWGTSGILSTPSGAIIESITVTPKNGKPIEITDNDGFAAVLVFLKDGFDATIKCLYDDAKTWPKIGDTVTLDLPESVGTGAAVPEGGFDCVCTADPFELKRGGEAMVGIDVIYRPNVVLA